MRVLPHPPCRVGDPDQVEQLDRAGTGVPAGRPEPHPQLLLDLDSTADPTHGEQEGSSYHGYYQQHMYHPLLIFDGHTNQLITAVLRPGTVPASRGGVAILKRLVAAIRARWPRVTSALRADSGLAITAVFIAFDACAAVPAHCAAVPRGSRHDATHPLDSARTP